MVRITILGRFPPTDSAMLSSILRPFFKGPPSNYSLPFYTSLVSERYSWAVSSYGFRDAFEHTLPLLQGASLQLFASVLHLSSFGTLFLDGFLLWIP